VALKDLNNDPLFASATPTGDATLHVDGVHVPVTTLERVYFPKSKQTKADLLDYYHRIAPTILAHLRDRPMILKRFPQGAGRPHFFQHEAGDVPPLVRTARVVAESGRELDYVVGGDEATLLYMAARGAIECHVWHSTIEDLEHPDRFVIDLDPGPRVRFDRLCEIALEVRTAVEEAGLIGFPKTSGSRGLHIFVPLPPGTDFDTAGEMAEAVASDVLASRPRHATVVRDPDDRPAGTVYVDHLQNSRAKSVAAPYSVRATPTGTVSTPLTWAEVEGVPDPREFTMQAVLDRVKRKGDLFAGALTAPVA
jgi:bifunctional non-homologous end joining protein LigD